MKMTWTRKDARNYFRPSMTGNRMDAISCLILGIRKKLKWRTLSIMGFNIFISSRDSSFKTSSSKKKSDKFMKKCHDVDHMEEVPRMLREDTGGKVFCILYLIRKDATTTKLRNVFNASSLSSVTRSSFPV